MSLENEIIGVDHLGILTGDLKRDVAWYEEKRKDFWKIYSQGMKECFL